MCVKIKKFCWINIFFHGFIEILLCSMVHLDIIYRHTENTQPHIQSSTQVYLQYAYTKAHPKILIHMQYLARGKTTIILYAVIYVYRIIYYTYIPMYLYINVYNVTEFNLPVNIYIKWKWGVGMNHTKSSPCAASVLAASAEDVLTTLSMQATT